MAHDRAILALVLAGALGLAGCIVIQTVPREAPGAPLASERAPVARIIIEQRQAAPVPAPRPPGS